jgi:hypothetical protein
VKDRRQMEMEKKIPANLQVFFHKNIFQIQRENKDCLRPAKAKRLYYQ